MGRKKKLTPGEKLLAGTLGLAMFPFMLTLETSKHWAKKHHEYPYNRKRRRK